MIPFIGVVAVAAMVTIVAKATVITIIAAQAQESKIELPTLARSYLA